MNYVTVTCVVEQYLPFMPKFRSLWIELKYVCLEIMTYSEELILQAEKKPSQKALEDQQKRLKDYKDEIK